MRTYCKLILAALAASALLALAVGSASAGRFSTNERNFELIWDEAISPFKTKFELIARSAGINVQCRLSLLGSFRESTITKTTGNNQGTINHGALTECEGGSATIKQETFPWNLRYRSFVGSLPTIQRLSTSILGFRLHIESAETSCEATTEANHPGIGIVEGGLESSSEPENMIGDRNARIPLRGSFVCEFLGEGEFGGVGLMRNLPRTAKLRITLI